MREPIIVIVKILNNIVIRGGYTMSGEEYLCIVAPAWNEEENIERFVQDWHSVVARLNRECNARLLVIDDGSTDGTRAALDALRMEYPYLEVETKPNGGHGSSVLFGYKKALQEGATWVFQTDTDGQTDAGEFDGFWRSRYDFDAIFGNRVSRGDGKIRALVERVVCMFVRHYFGVHVPDANAPFRLMHRNVLERILPIIPDDYNLPNIVITSCASMLGYRIDFREISFKPRTLGQNSINIKRIIKIGIKARSDFKVIAERARRFNG